jgi:RHS repeat-associated protein
LANTNELNILSFYAFPTHDAENQLVSVISDQGSVIRYRYDGLGRRIEKNVNGKITRYVYDNEDIILEYDGEGNLIAKYIHGPGIDEPLMMERDGKIYYFIPDALGSIRALVDTKGYIRQMYEYDAFGNIVQILDEEGAPIPINEAITNPYTFTGREFDPETGLYYYRARYYDPTIGRFLQEDPTLLLYLNLPEDLSFWSSLFVKQSMPQIMAQLPQRLSSYVYVTNNPLNWIDPYGEFILGECMRNPIREKIKRIKQEDTRYAWWRRAHWKKLLERFRQREKAALEKEAQQKVSWWYKFINCVKSLVCSRKE